METIKCKYRLPCGWCDRINEKCIFEQQCEDTKPSKNQDNDFIKEILDTQSTTAICIHEWEPMNSINTAGYVYRCRKCGAMKTEPITRGLQEYITTSGNEELNKKYSLWNSDSTNPCEHCSNNPKNSGSGVCHCILGLPKVTCDGNSQDHPFNMESIVDSTLTTNAPLYTSGYISVNTPTEVDNIVNISVTTSASTSEFEKCPHRWVWNTKKLAYRCTRCGEERYRGHKD